MSAPQVRSRCGPPWACVSRNRTSAAFRPVERRRSGNRASTIGQQGLDHEARQASPAKQGKRQEYIDIISLHSQSLEDKQFSIFFLRLTACQIWLLLQTFERHARPSKHSK